MAFFKTEFTYEQKARYTTFPQVEDNKIQLDFDTADAAKEIEELLREQLATRSLIRNDKQLIIVPKDHTPMLSRVSMLYELIRALRPLDLEKTKFVFFWHCVQNRSSFSFSLDERIQL